MTTEPSYVDYYDPRKKVVYIAGPYTADTPEGIDANIREAASVARLLWRYGMAAITPHLNTAHFEEDFDHQDKTTRVFYTGDLSIVKRCDAILMLPNWESSKGARMERDAALAWGLPVFYDVSELLAWSIPIEEAFSVGKTNDAMKNDWLRQVALNIEGCMDPVYVAAYHHFADQEFHDFIGSNVVERFGDSYDGVVLINEHGGYWLLHYGDRPLPRVYFLSDDVSVHAAIGIAKRVYDEL